MWQKSISPTLCNVTSSKLQTMRNVKHGRLNNTPLFLSSMIDKLQPQKVQEFKQSHLGSHNCVDDSPSFSIELRPPGQVSTEVRMEKANEERDI